MLRHQKLDPRRALQYKTIIIDESHGLKTRDSQRNRFLSPVLKAAKRVILLSGTPIDGKPVQAFSQVRDCTHGFPSKQRLAKGRHAACHQASVRSRQCVLSASHQNACETLGERPPCRLSSGLCQVSAVCPLRVSSERL